MVLKINTDTAFRTPDELAALVKAVFEASPDTQETRWIEWKSSLDLGAADGICSGKGDPWLREQVPGGSCADL